MMQDEDDYVVHYSQSEESPWLPKLLLSGGVIYVLLVVFAISMGAQSN